MFSFKTIRNFIPVIILLYFTNTVISQPFWVNSNLTPEQMVNVLIGQGVTTSDITYTGVGIASGSFGGASNIGLNYGILLTSGSVNVTVGPNNSGNAGYNNGAAGDPDLQAFSGVTSDDACVLEFDFIPQSSVVEFSYVFASEEYHEYANSSWNDAFGFFISGPGINGPYSNNSKNIALIPFTSPPIPVTINTVNNGTSNTGPCENCEYFVHNNQHSIQYDAWTTVLTAFAVVTPCERYHIKLAIGDGGDRILDSGVFLKANSFSSVGLSGNYTFSSQYIDSIAVEGCNNAMLTFELDDHAQDDFYIALEILGTAINGVDYDTIPDTLIIPQGYRIAEVEIIPWEDGLPEGFETVQIVYNSSLCEPNYDTINFEIYDYPEFNMMAREDTIIHCEDPVLLYTMEAGGMPPYFYNWSTGDTTSTVLVNPMNPTEFIVYVSDACGDTLIDTIFVDVIGPTAYAGTDTSICLNDTATLIAFGGTIYEWSTGDTTQTIFVSPTEITDYWVIVYDDCNNFDTDTVKVYVDSPQAYAGEDVTICIGDSTILTGGGGLYYEWNTGQTTQSITVNPLVDTEYWVYVTDNCNNTAVDSVWVLIAEEVFANAGEDQTICYGDQAILTATGGVEYEWSTGETTQTITVTPGTTSTYYVIVSDGCSDEDTVIVFVNPLPNIQANAASDIICYGDSVYLSSSGGDTYFWESNPADPSLIGQETSPNPLVAPLVTTVYTVTGTDLNSCENTSSFGVVVRDMLHSTFNLSLNAVCEGEITNVNYTGNALASANYVWNFDGGIITGSGQGPYDVYWNSTGYKTISLIVYQDGCESEQTIDSVLINLTPEVDFSAFENSGCVPFEVEFIDNSLDVLPDAEYSWDFGDGNFSIEKNPFHIFEQLGDYNIMLNISNNGCDDEKTIEGLIKVHPNPQADFSLYPTLTSIENPVISFSDNSSGDPVSWLWDLGDGNTSAESNFYHTYSDTGTFVVKLLISNMFGCTDSLFKNVIIKPHPKIFAPNAFSPNGDGLNDIFNVKANGIEEFSMSIYSRWGEMIFFTNDIGEGWDGKDAPVGTYVYYIAYKNNLGANSEIYGKVTLIK